MKDLMYNYGWMLILVLFLAAYLFWVFKKKGKESAFEQARAIALGLMIQAEKKYGTEDGALKMGWVVTRFYPALPPTARIIFREEDITKFLEEAYKTSKDYIDDGHINGSC